MSVTIRPASRADLPALERLLREAFDASYALFMPAAYVRDWRMSEEPARTLRKRLGDMAVAVSGETVVGFAATENDTLAELWVDPDRKRRGIGAKLLHWAEDRLRDRGSGAVTLSCYERNRNGLDFYRAMGYTVTSRSPSRRVAGGPVTVCTLKKPLDTGGR
ncbi:MAG: GNAT family N-acetyltransferase [Pseudodesulfovibrio sp.]